MTWPLCVLILGLVWWLPAVAFIGVFHAKIKQNEQHAENLRIATALIDKLGAL